MGEQRGEEKNEKEIGKGILDYIILQVWKAALCVLIDGDCCGCGCGCILYLHLPGSLSPGRWVKEWVDG